MTAKDFRIHNSTSSMRHTTPKQPVKRALLCAFAGLLAATSAFTADGAMPAAQKAKAAKTGRPAAVGPVVGENKATPVDRFKVPAGFKIELVYTVPGGAQGSWVNLCVDPKGRILASDQYGG